MTQLVAINAVNSEELRHSIENRVRHEDGEKALEELRNQLAPLCSSEGPFPANFARFDPRSIDFIGWNLLGDTIWTLDKCGEPVSGIGLELDIERINPDDGEPTLLTRFYFDTAWPFSQCTYSGLLEGYNAQGPAWHNDHADTDEDVVGIDGLKPLVDALQALHHPRMSERFSREDLATAHQMGSLYIACLFHMATSAMALRGGLPRPLAVFTETSDGQSVLCAPAVAACSESQTNDDFLPSLDFTKAPEPLHELQPRPQPAPVVSPEHEEVRDEAIAGMFAPPSAQDALDPANDPDTWHLPPPDIHTTGRQLRRQLVTPESISELVESGRRGLFSRLFRRR